MACAKAGCIAKVYILLCEPCESVVQRAKVIGHNLKFEVDFVDGDVLLDGSVIGVNQVKSFTKSAQSEDFLYEDTKVHSRPKRSDEEELMALMSKMGGDMSQLQSLFQGRTAPAQDMNGPILTCPPPIHQYADIIQVTTQVEWEEPMSYDEEDGQIKPRRYGPGPKYTFGEGVKTVLYLSRDKSGNLGKCELNVTVEVVRCKKEAKMDFPNGHYSCHPNSDFVYGSTCEYGCYEGYELVGEKKVTCEKSGKWSHAIPKCKLLTCPLLKPFAVGTFTCTDSNNFRSICSYTCKKGYVIKTGMSRIRVCMADRSWRGEEPLCDDKEPPRFTSCPGSVTAATDRGSTSAMVAWDVPKVRDNSEEDIKPELHSQIKNNEMAKIGVYDVKYEAQDAAGNKARPCRFKVIVKDLKCPVQYALPYMKVSCESGTGVGSKCTFSCQAGWILNGTESTQCQASKTVPPFATWDWSAGRPICTAVDPCRKPEPPVNGALACDLWENGRFCQMQCMKGTDIPPSFTAWKLFVCSESGKWNFKGALPACEKSNRAKKTVMSVSMHYYDGKCPDPEVKKQIRKNFIAALKDTPFAETWKKTDSKPENVRVICGAIRMKRSVDGKKKFKIQMKVDVETYLDSSMGIQESMKQVKANAMNILTLMKEDVKGDKSKLLPSSLVPSRKVEVESDGVQLHCPSGQFPSYRTYGCVGCTQGTFFNTDTRKCEECPRGQFQTQSGQNECVRCPVGMTTTLTGATSPEQCRPECQAGTFSAEGVEPCMPCEEGYFQPASGGKSCRQCPGGKSTMFQGSKHGSDCEDFDLSFSMGGSARDAVDLDIDTHVTGFVLSFWLKLSSSGQSDILTLTSRNTIHCHVDEDGKFVVHSERNAGIQKNITSDRWVFVHIEVTDESFAVTVDGETSTQQSFDGDAVVLEESLDIQLGGDGFEGSFHQVNIWSEEEAPESDTQHTCSYVHTDECQTSPCLHGTCTDGLNTHFCDCEEGYTGDNCDSDVDDCQFTMCENGATCKDRVRNYTCVCTPGFTGQFCNDAIVNGGWGEWSQWSECSKSCGGGRRTRDRRCDSPTPYNGGTPCEGEPSETERCSPTSCPEVDPPKEMVITFNAGYGDLYCDANVDDVISLVNNSAKRVADSLPCAKLGICLVKATGVQNCESGGRQKRHTAKPTVAFTVTVANTPGSSEELDVVSVQSSMRQLNGALIHLKDAAKKGKFTVYVDEKKHDLSGEPRVTAGVTCKEGFTRVDTHCIPCAPGTFYHHGYCEKCGRGSYQPLESELTCHDCPAGVTTAGRGATSAEECSVTCDPGHYMKDKDCRPCPQGEYQSEKASETPPDKEGPADKSPDGDEAKVSQPHLEIPIIIQTRKFPVGIVIGAVGVGCLCVTAFVLIVCKIRHNRFNKIRVKEMESQLQAIARAVTYITVPITGIQPNKVMLQPGHKKDI
ncbi:sushi, von Willebrand factor type A, EGF and pentraxin domain-containing protein 1-like [Haliotis asinina]|uniref:sushi, von Willebrand factor type A, EGF and pentraxin domain-containing protein 1-like n=1 Tax=Haliotis asinina TaxID=109174 RepID=UPI003531C045